MNSNGFPYKSLVASTDGHEVNSGALSTLKIEPVFRISGYRGLWLDTNNWSQEAGDLFTANSARSPENLLNHVQRIFHHVRHGNTENTYGAMLDLFIVLKNHGRPLRARMLNYTRPLLQGERFDRLQRLLDEDLHEQDVVPVSPRSILSMGFHSPYRLVQKLDTRDEPERNPLAESRGYMEYGQLDSARSVLESEVLSGSEQVEVHSDLVEIYRHSHDRENFEKIFPLVQTRQEFLLRLWRELNDFFVQALDSPCK